MKTIMNYIEEYGDTSFKDLKLNNLDSSIFSFLTYINCNDLYEKEMTINTLLTNFLLFKEKKEFLKHGFFQKDIYDLIEILVDKKRYKDIIISNYVYKIDNNEQFGAMTFIFNNTKYIAFEGTDELLVGWEEDFTCSYLELTPADKDAIKYLKKEIKLSDKEVYVGGHSKGGRLAITSSMYLPFYKKNKIKNIYNFDGPGLLEELYNSNKYKSIENKILQIVSKNTIIGLLLKHNNNYKVVNTNKIGINAHSIFNWEINDTDFKYTELSIISKKLDTSIALWLEEHDNYERKIITKSIFNTFRNNNLTTITEVFKIKNIINIFNNKDLDKDTLAILKGFLEFNIKNILK